MHAVAVSPSGKTALSSSWGELRVWDLETRALRLRIDLGGHAWASTALAVLDDRTGVGRSYDTATSKLTLWDLASGAAITEEAADGLAVMPSPGREAEGATVVSTIGGSKQVNAMKVVRSPDGSLSLSNERASPSIAHAISALATKSGIVLAGKDDGTIAVRDLGSLDEATTFTAHKRRIASIALDDTGTRALTCCEHDGVRLWRLKRGGEPELEATVDLSSIDDNPLKADLAPDGSWFVVGTERGLVLRYDVR